MFYHGFRFLFSVIRLGNFFSCKVPDSISHNSALQLQHKRAVDSMQMNRCGSVPINLHKLSAGWIWLRGHSLMILAVPHCGFLRRVHFPCDCFSTKCYFSSVWRNPFHIHKMLVAINFLSHCLTGIVLISPSFLKEIFTECRILGQLLPPATWRTLFDCFLVSFDIEKSVDFI